MKSLICVLLLAAAVFAEPPRYRVARYRSEKQEVEGSGSERKESAAEAPYPAAGYKPSKEFKLPSRVEVAPPATSYGVPDDSYSAPQRLVSRPEVEYGFPRMAKREEGEEVEKEGGKKEGGETEKGEKSEKKEESEEGEGEEEKGELKEEGEKKKESKGEGEGEKKEKLEEEPEKDDDDIVSTQGVYYVLLPGSQLQRVHFKTENDISKMAYTARLQYKDEDRAPLLVYSAVPEYTVPVAEYQYPASSAYFKLY